MLLILLTAIVASPSPQALGLWWILGQGLMTAAIADALVLLIRQRTIPFPPDSLLGLWRRRKGIAGKIE